MSGTDASAEAAASHQRPGLAFWITAAIGGAIVAFGIMGLLEHEPRGAESAIRWYIGGALVLDLIVVPIGAAAGALAKRLVPTDLWPPVRTALLTSVVLIAVAAPLVLEPQGPSSNASIRPRDYGQGLAIALTATWVATAGWIVVRRRRATS